MRKLIFLFVFLFSVIFTPNTFAKSSSFVSVVNPIRGSDFWELKNQTIEESVLGEIAILDRYKASATWLLRFDVFDNLKILETLKSRVDDEKGLFLEITPTWTKVAGINYRSSSSWHSAGSAFLTGYERDERLKLIDTAFENFKLVFGFYPKSVGSWWIDSYSLSYMQKKYGIISALIVADQYTTDNYQIWGQFWSTPYYPSKNNALQPTQNNENKIPIVIVQWASRDPVNAYGNGVDESTFSVQANDYIDYHNLSTSYFAKLVDIYTDQEFNQFSHLAVGLENSYSWDKYSPEYEKQIKLLSQKEKEGQFGVVTMENFALWYQKQFPEISPPQIIIAEDPLGTFKKAVWFMNPYYRVGWFFNQDGSVIRDIRQYAQGEELCFLKRCDEVNFATSATRVLDDVSFGHKWVIDEGKIQNFNVSKNADGFIISYLNEAGKTRTIGFLPKDISLDGKSSSIDSRILQATGDDKKNEILKNETGLGNFEWNFISASSKILKFAVFFIILFLSGGFLFSERLIKTDIPLLRKIFLSSISGMVLLTLMFYILSIFKLRFGIYFYLLLMVALSLKLGFLKLKDFRLIKFISKVDLVIVGIAVIGVVFQVTPTFKSGLLYPYGVGFWGPNTHDGIWHIALINQIIKGFPIENPIFANQILQNYHFFYDLLIAVTNYISGLPVVDLIFRFYPIIFSLLLGIGVYQMIKLLFEQRIGVFKTKVATIFSLYLVYFAGSFGWIVEYIKNKEFGGESDFWVNQAVSFNLNPPFAISLLIVIAIVLVFIHKSKKENFFSTLILIVLCGSLVSFKAYGGVLVLTSLLLISLVEVIRNRDFSYLYISFLAICLTLWLFISNFESKSTLLIFSPFWFIHSMIDSPDRVGWVRLTLTRTVGFSQHNFLKLIGAEFIGFLIFFLGNLGLRIFSLGIIIKFRSILKSTIFLFIAFLSLFSVLIPMLFIQSGNPWNTIQFFYYFLYISAIISGITISNLVFKLSGIKAYILIILIVIVAPINSFTTASGYFGLKPHGKISTNELSALEFLSSQEDGIVLTYPYDKKFKERMVEPWPLFVYDSTSYVSAFSKKATYLEDIGQNQILLTDYKKRLVTAKDFFLNPSSKDKHFLKENNIKYIYLPKLYEVSLDNLSKDFVEIFQNKEVIIYKVLNNEN